MRWRSSEAGWEAACRASFRKQAHTNNGAPGRRYRWRRARPGGRCSTWNDRREWGGVAPRLAETNRPAAALALAASVKRSVPARQGVAWRGRSLSWPVSSTSARVRAITGCHDTVRRAEAPCRARDLPTLGVVVVAGGILGPLLMMSGSPAPTPRRYRSSSTSRLSQRWRSRDSARTTSPSTAGRGGSRRVRCRRRGPRLVGIEFARRRRAARRRGCLFWDIDNDASRQLAPADRIRVADQGKGGGRRNLGLAAGAALPGPAASIGTRRSTEHCHAQDDPLGTRTMASIPPASITVALGTHRRAAAIPNAPDLHDGRDQ
jgi:hypothetical protein